MHLKLPYILMGKFGWHWVNEDPGFGLEPPAIQQLEQIHAPTLIITGECTGADLQVMADLLQVRIPNARKIVLNDVGHVPNMEAPQTVNEILVEFLASLSSGFFSPFAPSA